MKHMDEMIEAALAAAVVIREVYAQPFEVLEKSDSSPVTVADTRAETVIIERLAHLGLPVLAEESVSAGRVPQLDGAYFVVDPLDGTKEFLKRNGEFTVNIALCENNRPTLGIILAPATGVAYWGGPDGAFGGTADDHAIRDRHPIATVDDGPMRIVASRSHGHPAIPQLCEKLNVIEDISVGSSLKFGLVATGAAQIYPRFGPTSEWDTAAGQAIVEAAGGVVLDFAGQPLTCGHRDRKFLNGPFLVASGREMADRALAQIAKLPQT